jgi:hypothetical protein
MAKNPEDMTLAELCELAEVQYQERVVLAQQLYDLNCQTGC